MRGKRYPEEFENEAVTQVFDRGYSVSSVATKSRYNTPYPFHQDNEVRAVLFYE